MAGDCLNVMGDCGSFVPSRRIPANDIDHLALGRRSDPGGRIGRNTSLRPGRQSGGERLLQRLFRQVERTREADQSRDDSARLLFVNRFC